MNTTFDPLNVRRDQSKSRLALVHASATPGPLWTTSARRAAAKQDVRAAFFVWLIWLLGASIGAGFSVPLWQLTLFPTGWLALRWAQAKRRLEQLDNENPPLPPARRLK